MQGQQHLQAYFISIIKLPKLTSPVIQLLLVEPNLFFRLGLKLHLQQSGIFNLVAEVESIEMALRYLPKLERVDAILLGLDNDNHWRWCERLRFKYPQIPILLMLPDRSPLLAKSAQQWGIEATCSRDSPPSQVLIALQKIAQGEAAQTFSSANLTVDLPILTMVRSQLYHSGIRQIEHELTNLERKTKQSNSNTFLISALISAQMRELKAAKWLLQKIYGASRLEKRTRSANISSLDILIPKDSTSNLSSSLYLDRVASWLQSDLINQTDTPLEIDILKPHKRRELLYTVLRQLEDLLAELEKNPPEPEAIALNSSDILAKLWLATVEDFYSRIDSVITAEIIKQITADLEIVKVEILTQIPLLPELLTYLLAQNNANLDVPNPTDTFNWEPHIEEIIAHLLIQIANGAVQPLLNHFSDRLEIQLQLFDSQHISSREMERFRNDLSWRYRLQINFEQPKAIFESRYRLFRFANLGIETIDIYAPRPEELQSLNGIRAWVTLALELQDAVSPRFRTVGIFLGRGIVYLLTNLIGKGIGLVGKGILQGIGNAWQEPRSRK
jgi:DNA-binding NarL/FixJ family response regulator